MDIVTQKERSRRMSLVHVLTARVKWRRMVRPRVDEHCSYAHAWC